MNSDKEMKIFQVGKDYISKNLRDYVKHVYHCKLEDLPEGQRESVEFAFHAGFSQATVFYTQEVPRYPESQAINLISCVNQEVQAFVKKIKNKVT